MTEDSNVKLFGEKKLVSNIYSPILFLILLPFVVHLPQWLFGMSTDPMLFFSGLGRDLQRGMFLGLPYLDPNAGFTSQALGHLAAWDWVHGIVPWWNPYSGIGMPLAGEMQPGAFFLPFNLLLLLPNGVLWLQIAMQIIAGLATYALLRELNLTRLAATMGGALFALNGTIAWTPGPVAISCALAFLPLLLWGIERARKPGGGAASTLAVGISIAWSLLAGFPETAYIDGLFALAWAVYRLLTDDRRKALILRVVSGGILGVLIAAPLLVAFVDYLFQSDAMNDHGLGKAHLGWSALPTMFIPYVFGASAESYTSSALAGIWGNIGGYIGILTVFSSMLAITTKSVNRSFVFFLCGWILIAWAKTFGIEPVLSLINYIPFLGQAAFYRYAPPSWELAAIILAAFGLDSLLTGRCSRPAAALVGAGLIAATVALAWPERALWDWSAQQLPQMFRHLRLSIAYSGLGLIAAILAVYLLRAQYRRTALATLIILDSICIFAVPQLTGMSRGYADSAAVQFLKDHQGLSRNYTLGPLEPNYGAYFQIPSINHNMLPVPNLWAGYVDHNIFPELLARSSGIIFWAGFYPKGYAEKALSAHIADTLGLGVKYLITDHDAAVMPLSSIPVMTTGNQALPLQNNQSTSVIVTAPPPATPDALIKAVNVMVGTYGMTADGVLVVRICIDTECRLGQLKASEAEDNALVSLPLDKPLKAPAGVSMNLTFTYRDASRGIALWDFPEAAGSPQSLQGPAGALPGRALRLSFQYGMGASNLRKVFSDVGIDIWEIENPAPYFEIESGGPCVFLNVLRETVETKCDTHARLRRRELYMPGWRASVNGTPATITQDGEIFQSIDLPAGSSRVIYHFAPPFIGIGWAASFFGLVGLFWNSFLRGALNGANFQNSIDSCSMPGIVRNQPAIRQYDLEQADHLPR